MDEYVVSRRGNHKLFDLNSYPFRGDIHDPYVIQKFEEVSANTEETKTLSEILQRLSNKNGWGAKDEVFLSSCPVEEYYDFFKQQNSEELHHYVKRCLEFGDYSKATDRQQSIAERAREALRRIAKESAINRMRVEKTYGVKLERPPEERAPEES